MHAQQALIRMLPRRTMSLPLYPAPTSRPTTSTPLLPSPSSPPPFSPPARRGTGPASAQPATGARRGVRGRLEAQGMRAGRAVFHGRRGAVDGRVSASCGGFRSCFRLEWRRVRPTSCREESKAEKPGAAPGGKGARAGHSTACAPSQANSSARTRKATRTRERENKNRRPTTAPRHQKSLLGDDRVLDLVLCRLAACVCVWGGVSLLRTV